MAAPLALPRGHDIHLDAMLAWVWMLRHRPDAMECIDRGIPRSEIIRPHLPVAVATIGQHEVALCSSMRLPSAAELRTTTWTRRKDGEDMHMRSRRISGSSPERPQLNRADSVVTPWVEWICWGDRREVAKALDLVHHVGGLRAHGHGMVRRWEVDATDHAPADTWYSMGRTQRVLPEQAVKTMAAPVRLGVQAPYWPTCMQVYAHRAGTIGALTPQARGALDAAA